ncbi:MAG TPA: sialidase family protein [Nitriliruptorales bacterium]|nr:sialidase family protein [Nitriliruptorales bacterium]
MRRKQRMWSLIILIAGSAPISAGSSAVAQNAASPSVTAAVQVTNNPDAVRAHSSPQIARNPTNGELVVVESDVRGSRSCDVHISADQGRSWFPGGGMMKDPYLDCSFYAEYGPYATTAFGVDGTLYVAFVASEFLNRARDDTPRHVFLARSNDGARTFQTSMVFEAPDGKPDRGLNKGPTLAVDPSDPQRVYVGWRQGVFNPQAKEKLKSNIAASADGGRTFGPPVDLTDERGGDYPQIAVDSEGTVHAVYWTRVWPRTPPGEPGPVRPIMHTRSTDHGATFSQPQEADPGNRSASRPAALAADPDSGNLYLVWHGNAEIDNDGEDFAGDLDIFLRSSADGGESWTDRLVVNDDESDVNQYEPGIAIAPNGRVDIAWYDFRHTPSEPITSSGHSGDAGLSDVYYASSTDGGRSFGASARITDRSIDRSLGVWSNNIDSKFNVGVASTDETVFVAWQDTRNAIGSTDAEDVYTATVQLNGVPAAAALTTRANLWWAPVGAAFVLGMGVSMLLAWLVTRRSPRPSGVAAEGT